MKTQLLSVLAVLTLIFGAQYVFQQQGERQSFLQGSTDYTKFCPKQSYRDDATFNKFLTKLKDAFSTSDRVELIKEECATNSIVFSESQIQAILDTLNFTDDKIEAIKTMSNFIPYLTPNQITGLLKKINFSSSKLEALETLAPYLLNADEKNKSNIANGSFTMSSDKKKAREILDKVVERNCLFGSVDEKVAVFVIDISGSMDYTFKTELGTTSRLNYVKQHLKKTISEQLREYQSFNIVAFCSYSKTWKNSPVAATTENIKEALRYIDGLSTCGATNISDSLVAAFSKNEGVKGVYLLSDGVPNYGVQNIPDMVKLVKNQEAKVGNDVKINTISFLMGGIEKQSERDLSRQYLEQIAVASYMGSFRQMSQE